MAACDGSLRAAPPQLRSPRGRRHQIESLSAGALFVAPARARSPRCRLLRVSRGFVPWCGAFRVDSARLVSADLCSQDLRQVSYANAYGHIVLGRTAKAHGHYLKSSRGLVWPCGASRLRLSLSPLARPCRGARLSGACTSPTWHMRWRRCDGARIYTTVRDRYVDFYSQTIKIQAQPRGCWALGSSFSSGAARCALGTGGGRPARRHAVADGGRAARRPVRALDRRASTAPAALPHVRCCRRVSPVSPRASIMHLVACRLMPSGHLKELSGTPLLHCVTPDAHRTRCKTWQSPAASCRTPCRTSEPPMAPPPRRHCCCCCCCCCLAAAAA